MTPGVGCVVQDQELNGDMSIRSFHAGFINLELFIPDGISWFEMDMARMRFFANAIVIEIIGFETSGRQCINELPTTISTSYTRKRLLNGYLLTSFITECRTFLEILK